MALPRIARLTVTAGAGEHFLADITDDNGDVLFTLDAENDKARHKLCKILKRHGAEHDVSYDVPGIFAVVCMGLKEASLPEAAQIITEIFKDAYEQLVTIYWFFVDDGVGGEALLGAKIGPFPHTITFALTENDTRSVERLWRQFDDRVTDGFIGWTSVGSGPKCTEVDLTPERYAKLEDALLELAGLFSFNH